MIEAPNRRQRTCSIKKRREVLQCAVVMVAREGIEPPTPAFSGLPLNGSYLIHSQAVILYTPAHFGPLFCDHNKTTIVTKIPRRAGVRPFCPSQEFTWGKHLHFISFISRGNEASGVAFKRIEGQPLTIESAITFRKGVRSLLLPPILAALQPRRQPTSTLVFRTRALA